MAFTKSPEASTRQFHEFPVQGTESWAHAAHYINCAPVKYSQYGGDPDRVIRPRPPMSFTNSISGIGATSVLRGVYIDDNLGHAVIVAGGNVYLNGTSVGAMAFSTGYVGITKYVVGATVLYILLETHISASRIHSLTTAGVLTTTNLAVGAFGNPIFLDGYIFVGSHPDGAGSLQRIYNSSISSPTTFTTGTDYIDAEMEGDILLAIDKHKNKLVAFGENSIEFFENKAIQIGSPLVRMVNSSINNIGMFRKTSGTHLPIPPVVSIGEDLFFIGTKSFKSSAVYRLRSYAVEEISSMYINELLENDDYVATYRQNNHLFTVKAYGTVCLILALWGTAEGPPYYFFYNPNEHFWGTWTMPSSGLSKILFTSGSGKNVSADYSDRLFGYWNNSGTDNVGSLQIRPDNTGVETVTAQLHLPMFKGEVNNQKHWVSLDIMGYFPPTIAVNLTIQRGSFNGTALSIPYTRTVTTYDDGSMHELRFTNLGKSRSIKPYMTIIADGSWYYAGSRLVYNIGTQ